MHMYVYRFGETEKKGAEKKNNGFRARENSKDAVREEKQEHWASSLVRGGGGVSEGEITARSVGHTIRQFRDQ